MFKISFNKVVGHLFSDPMSLVIYEVPPWLVLSGEFFKNLTCPDEITISDSFKDLFFK